MNQFRQGDVFLEQIKDVPRAAELLKGPIVLAEGEATGHCHSIKSRSAKLYGLAAERFLRVVKPVILEHQEHDPLELPVGIYRVVRQLEYLPEGERRVQD